MKRQFQEAIIHLIVNNRTHALKTDINLFFTITNCQIVRSLSLTHRINYKFMCLSAYGQQKLATARARISAVIVKFSFILTKIVVLKPKDKSKK